jgi:hypothetical protein
VDLVRTLGEPSSKIAARVNRGREILSAWLKLVEIASETKTGCSKCGKLRCDYESCREGSIEILELSKSLPLNAVLEMDAPRWRSVLKALGNPEFKPVQQIMRKSDHE